MNTFEPLDYVLALNHRHNCSCIESIKAGQRKKVLVYPEQDVTAKPILADATLNQEGTELTIKVTTPDGQQDSFYRDYQKLKREISNCKPD